MTQRTPCFKPNRRVAVRHGIAQHRPGGRRRPPGRGLDQLDGRCQLGEHTRGVLQCGCRHRWWVPEGALHIDRCAAPRPRRCPQRPSRPWCATPAGALNRARTSTAVIGSPAGSPVGSLSSSDGNALSACGNWDACANRAATSQPVQRVAVDHCASVSPSPSSAQTCQIRSRVSSLRR